ncbi:tetratricopeptide repeat protein [Pyxidicoccus parkwayensis]|uniref:Tetratricopeptide repeat protein n=1 Tax=Pyxidicoccus parkwayensis TaxID=2813578 RepID=A0ABX7NPF7_9BACT|nr:tetratricopeptide repeat protein [Pyxidicoccus parkwaysis]QSQ20323.1 tetratricopeptide repeat protein [Pyxidicoccus parkwaysis]
MTEFKFRGAWLVLLVPLIVPLLVRAQALPPPEKPEAKPPPPPPPAALTPSIAAPKELSPEAKDGIRLAQENCASDGFDRAGCDKAVKLLQEAQRKDPENNDVQLALAQAYWNTSFKESPQARTRGELKQRALDIYQGMVDRGTKDARPYWELSLRQKTDAMRVTLLERVVALNPFHPRANRDLAQAQLSEGNVEAAEKSYEKHLEVSPYRDSQDALDHMDFAKRLANAGRPEAAAQVMEKVSKLIQGERRSTRCEIWRSVDARLYQSKSDVVQKVRSLLPYCTKTEELERASDLEKQGRVDEAIDAAKRQVAENPRPEGSYVLLERLYHRKGRPDEAAQVALNQLDAEPDVKERCERFRALKPATVRAMPRDRVETLRRDCKQPE